MVGKGSGGKNRKVLILLGKRGGFRREDRRTAEGVVGDRRER
jgi:hypothetical protein